MRFFSIHPDNVSILHVKEAYGAWSESRFTHYSLCFVPWCPLANGRCARDALPHTFNIGMFKCDNFTTIKYIYNEFDILIDSCDVAFDISNWWNLPNTVAMVGMESMVIRARLRHTRYYLTPCICSPIKQNAMEKWYHSLPESTHSCYDTYFEGILLKGPYLPWVIWRVGSF